MRMIMPVVLTSGFVIAGTLAGLAHTKMTASVPRNGANVASPPSAIEMTFAKPLRLTMVKVVRTEDQRQMPIAGELPNTFATSVKAAVTPLPLGSYQVSWTAVAEDGHVMKGSFAFSVSEGATAPAR